MNLKDYIQGKRHGKEANELERKALNDVFLQDALDGFDAVQGEHVPVIEELEKQIIAPKSTKKITPVWRWAAAVIAFLLIGTSLLEIFDIGNKNQPQTAVVMQPKVENHATKKKDSVIVADNIKYDIHSRKITQRSQNSFSYDKSNTLTPTPVNDTIEEVNVTALKSKSDYENAVMPIQNKELSYGNQINDINSGYSKPTSSLNGYVSGLSIQNTDDTNWLKDDTIKIASTLSKEAAKSTIITKKDAVTALQGKVAGVMIDENRQAYGSNSANTSDNIKIRGISSITNKPIKLTKGRILDENGEPLIGVNVVVKGTKNGTVTNVDGEFALPLVDVKKDSLLMASYVGMVSKEIPIKTNVGDIKLLADNKALNEVVVTGYGTQKRSSMTGSISVVSNKKYVFYKKQFVNYFKQNYDKSICADQKVKVKVSFNLNENGHPENIIIIKTNCPEMTDEIKKRLENSPNWTKRNKKIVLRLNLKKQ